MKKIALVLAATFIGTAAMAQETTIIKKQNTMNRTVVEEDDSPTVVEKRKVTTTGSIGCKSKTTAKTDEFGDTTVKQKTKC